MIGNFMCRGGVWFYICYCESHDRVADVIPKLIGCRPICTGGWFV